YVVRFLALSNHCLIKFNSGFFPSIACVTICDKCLEFWSRSSSTFCRSGDVAGCPERAPLPMRFDELPSVRRLLPNQRRLSQLVSRLYELAVTFRKFSELRFQVPLF